METFQFQLTGNWRGGRLGEGRIRTHGLDTPVSVPGEMGGPGIGTNPDELLLAAAANCYMITLAILLEKRELGVSSLECASEAIVVRDGGRLTYKRIVHRPTIALRGADEKRIALAEQCARQAERTCMISQALKGNVEVSAEPRIVAGES